MNIGPLFFAQPWALIGLIALPIIFWLMRATPPAPQRATLPSLALLDGLNPDEETPANTPWWIIALRFTAAAAAIIGFSQPVFQPVPQNAVASNTSTLVIVDDGWTSANQWSDITKTISSATDQVTDTGGDIRIIFSASLKRELDTALGAEDLRKRLQLTAPSPWSPNHTETLSLIQEADFEPSHILWMSDGFEHTGTNGLTEYLSDIGNVEIYSFAPKASYAITSAQTVPNGALVELKRIASADRQEARVVAENNAGLSLATTTAVFETDQDLATAEFSIPAAILNQVSRFRVLGSSSAGQVWLWDDTSNTPSVAIADPSISDQPLLEEYYYVRKALAPHAQLMEGDLGDMLARSPDAIILGDRSLIDHPLAKQLEDWVKDGGALIRFAGPKLAAANTQILTPTQLRPATRALGGALAWEKPQTIATFPETKAFASIKTPEESILVRKQVLAQPSSDLAAKTWAKLSDGTPLVTARTLGRGTIILFHVTATPLWSDLPYDGAFVSMLRRSAASGNGKRQETPSNEGNLAPHRVLDAFGALNAPSGDTKPVSTENFATSIPSQATPPGLYQGPQGSRALNVGNFAPVNQVEWPSNALVFEEALSQTRRGLEGIFLMLAFALLLVDVIISLLVTGRFRKFSRHALTVMVVMFGSYIFAVDPAVAQSAKQQDISAKQREAALQMRFAYVETDTPSLNLQLKAGLTGLNLELYRRTSVEPAAPHAVKLGVDPLDLYPMIYYAPPRNAAALSPEEIEALNSYLRNGGSLVIDTRDAIPGQKVSSRLKDVLKGLDVPPLQPTPPDHVLSRSFYLLNEFPGRIASGQLWIEANHSEGANSLGDRVSRVYIGASDWIGAWAIDENKRPLNLMDGQETNRERAYRFGINLVMCVLTGNYKEDQVHVPALLQRLDQENSFEPKNNSNRRKTILPSPDSGNPQDLDDFFESMRKQRDQQEAQDPQ